MNTPERFEGMTPSGPSGPALPAPAGLRRRRRFLLGIGMVMALVVVAALAWPRSDPDVLWRKAQDALHAGRIDEAEAASRRLAGLREPIDLDLMLEAQVAIARDRVDEALAILDRVPDSSPMTAQAKLLTGQLELRRDRLRAAEEAFLEALALNPGLDQARRELIFIYGYRSQSEGIEEQFRRLAGTTPLSSDDAFLWSLIRGVQWSPAEIVEQLSKAVRADPDDRQSRIALADALVELTRFDEAEEILRPLDPADPDVKAALGRLALERGDVPALRSLLAEAPGGHVGLALLRGRLALQLRDPGSAIPAYREALELRENDRDALSGLSQALNQAGRRDEAAEVIERLNQVTSLNNLLNDLTKIDSPRGPEQFVALGEACEAIGFEPQARAWYQAAISADPFRREAQEGLARLGRSDGGTEGGPSGS